MERIEAVIGAYPNTEPLFAEPLVTADARVEFRDLATVVGGSVRRAQSFGLDIFEMPIVSYLVARAHGLDVTALPVFVTRQFDHGRFVANLTVGVATPKDLEGRCVGCRYWGFTDATWARGVLSESFGVDLDRVRWVTSEAETVPEAELPANVERRDGADLVAMLVAGELAAYMLNVRQVIDSPVVGPLIRDVEMAQREWFATTGVLPIHHTVVVRDAVLAAHPDLGVSLIDSFARGTEAMLARLDRAGPASPAERAIAEIREVVGADPFPCGIAANRTSLEMLLRLCRAQHLLSETPPLEELFFATQD